MDRTVTQDHHETSWGEAIGKTLMLFVLLRWIYVLVWPNIENPWILPDYANLLVHEGGHILFSLFGEFFGILGGSLTQILIPIAFAFYFIQRMQWFSFNFCLFWVGDNIINVARYIMDSRAQELPLLGGEGMIHDWNWLLTRMNLLNHDILIGRIVFFFGVMCMVVSLGMIIMDIYYSFKHTATFSRKEEL